MGWDGLVGRRAGVWVGVGACVQWDGGQVRGVGG